MADSLRLGPEVYANKEKSRTSLRATFILDFSRVGISKWNALMNQNKPYKHTLKIESSSLIYKYTKFKEYNKIYYQIYD